MTDKTLREMALHYHRYPRPGKLSITATKLLGNQRDSGARLFAWGGGGLRRHCRRSVGSGEPDRKAEPGRRYYQRFRRSRPRQHRGAGVEAGDGGQGGAVQEVRRHRRLRYRGRRIRPGQVGRHHRQPGTDFRRHQPRRHQVAGVLHRRRQAPRTDENPGLPRRPARHGDRRRGGPGQRIARRRQEDERRQTGIHGRRRRRHCLPRPVGPIRHEKEQHHPGRRHRRRLRGPQTGHEPGKSALRPKNQGSRPGCGDRRRRRFPRAIGARNPETQNGQEDGR